jgi:hypothetical protein
MGRRTIQAYTVQKYAQLCLLLNIMNLRAWVFFFFMGWALRAQGQKVFLVDYASQADLKVFVVPYSSQADLLVYKVEYASQVGQNEGLWHFVDYASQADKKVFLVEYESQADLKICFVDYKSQAGWKSQKRRHLLFEKGMKKPG